MTWALPAVLSYLVLDVTTGVSAAVIHLLGRKQNLTGRTEIWSIVRNVAGSHWVRVEYQSFWLVHRLKILWGKLDVDTIQAHDGYLEQHLELGYIGVVFIITIMLSGLLRARRLLERDHAAGAFTLCLIVTAALYNHTEAALYAVSNIWLLLVMAVIEAPEAILAPETRWATSINKF